MRTIQTSTAPAAPRRLLALSLLALAAPPLAAQNVVISDTEFYDADWDFVVARVHGNGGSGLAVQQTSGGNPGNHRYVEHTVNAAGAVGSYIGYFHGLTAQPYNPAVSGPVGAIDVYLDAYSPGGSQALSVAIRQNGVVYLAGYQLTANVAWSTYAFTGLDATSFVEVLGTATPDLGPTGAPFEVGFFTANSTCTGCGSYTFGAYYDNFHFVMGVAPPAAYCTAGTSASGCRALLSSSGLPSASAGAGFVVTASGVEGAKAGLFCFGANGRQAAPWGAGSSFQCVTPPVYRGALLPGTGTPGQCDGTTSYDLNARWAAKPYQNPGAGAVVQAQLWYRDPLHPSGTTTSLSNALEFFVQP